MRIVLMYASAPRTVHEDSLDVAAGCTLEQVLAQAGWLTRFPEIGTELLTTCVWGRKADLDHILREGDRVEVVRLLRVDPKVARRERFVGQGARSTGLFAKRRPGSKAGY
ncbi:RnfH family protein [Hydrogenophaga sp.]|jgi:putative ubiquitin-RnfH superfamily antitoxin RatB of RatAB toxin-antitoxin module|uniref:RnfH family protein n=1 Tax=Hydrogenophaga sp. TaxID=1904254 RepID=UPI003F6E64DF